MSIFYYYLFNIHVSERHNVKRKTVPQIFICNPKCLREKQRERDVVVRCPPTLTFHTDGVDVSHHTLGVTGSALVRTSIVLLHLVEVQPRAVVLFRDARLRQLPVLLHPLDGGGWAKDGGNVGGQGIEERRGAEKKRGGKWKKKRENQHIYRWVTHWMVLVGQICMHGHTR